jgi:hypothetical protein
MVKMCKQGFSSYFALTAALLVGFSCQNQPVGEAETAEKTEKIPVIYCTDLFHPHDDPDDHFDLATLYAIPELELKAIILDQGRKQLIRPGRIPVSQMNRITGRSVPAAIGLAEKLAGPGDTGLDQPQEFQAGVELLLKTLRETPLPLNIITVGSVRDLAAAFNRAPELLQAKVARVISFIGEASTDYLEYNVTLDPEAYVCLMRSGLPLYWVPCFDGHLEGAEMLNNGHASYWRVSHKALLKDCTPEVLQYFIYCLEKQAAPPLEFIHQQPKAQSVKKLFGGERNLWCTAVFTALTNRRIVIDGARFLSVAPDSAAGLAEHELFNFEPVYVTISDEAQISYGEREGANKIMRFKVADMEHYAAGMTSITAQFLSSLRMVQ